MKTKNKKQKGATQEAVEIPVSFPLPNYGLRETFTADSVTIEEPGRHSTTHTRAEVEGWLTGMNTARRLGDETACREAVARTIQENCRSRGNETLTKTESQQTSQCSRKSETPHVVSCPKLAAILCVLCVLCGFIPTARCYEITPGFTFSDGQQLYAGQLEQFLEGATINPQFYNDQQTTPVLGGGYYFLILNPANQTLYRINAQQVLYGNTNIFLNAPPEAVPAYGLLLFCDPTNGWVASTTVSNFLWNSASNIDVAGLSFANTNNGGATNAYVLPRWPYPVFSGLNTNYPAHFIVFDTNGVAYRMSLTNAEVAFAFDLGTVMSLPYEYEQEFAPWRLYGTNTVSPYTNAFGWQTNFPITAYFEPNNGNTLTNATLTDTDTVPVNAFQQGAAGSGSTTGQATNTTMTLLALYEYMTNKNALPPYTIARTQFAGAPAVVNVTNMNNVTGIVTNLPIAINWTNPTPVSFMGSATMIPTSPQVVSNMVYWAQVTNASVLSFQLFTNWASAEARLSPIQGNGVNPVNGGSGGSGGGVLYYVTNYTAVNCVVIQESKTASMDTGDYGVWFTNLQPQSAFYYVSGSVLAANGTGVPPAVFLNYNNGIPLSTNYALVGTGGSGNGYMQFSMVQVLIQPQ